MIPSLLALVLAISVSGVSAYEASQANPETVKAAERALALAAPRSYLAYVSARDARDAVIKEGGAALQAALRARERADATYDAAREARNTAGREAFEKAADEVGTWEAMDAQRRAEAAATEAVIEAGEAQERVYRETNSPGMRALKAAEGALWRAEKRLSQVAPGPWLLYVEAAGLNGVVIPPR